ncbi:unnamed protein product [Cuscuta europaea]|uniref:Uncharacterized protein n=1 Tax=Cuscuta europaea TaxID=41803 RepID=A0A9P1E830_CUSEU|nr:unnamed protein product [Cuscuta europaea]
MDFYVYIPLQLFAPVQNFLSTITFQNSIRHIIGHKHIAVLFILLGVRIVGWYLHMLSKSLAVPHHVNHDLLEVRGKEEFLLQENMFGDKHALVVSWLDTIERLVEIIFRYTCVKKCF